MEAHVLQPLVDLAHDLFPQSGAGVAAGIDHLIGLIAAPHSRAVIGREAHKVAILRGVGGTGLAADAHAGEARTGTGAAGNNVLQDAAHQVRRALLHGRVEFDLVINDDLALRVLHPYIGSGRGIDAVVDEGAISRRHFLGGHAVGKAAQRHVAHLLGIRFRQRGKAQLVPHEQVGFIHAVHHVHPHGAGVQRAHQSRAHIRQPAVGAAGVSGPDVSVEQNGIVVDDGRRRNGAVVQRRRIGGHRLHSRTALPHFRGPVPASVSGLDARAAHHGHHVARIGIHHGNSRLQRLSVGVLGVQILGVFKYVFSDLLVLQILGCIDLVGADDLAAAVRLAVFQVVDLHEFLRHVLDDLIGEIGVVGLYHLFAGLLLGGGRHIPLLQLTHTGVAVGKGHLLVAGRLVDLLLLDNPLVVHILQHLQLPRAVVGQRPFADKGVIAGGVVGDGDKAGALGQCQILGVLAEIHPRGRLGAVARLAEIHRVEVASQDLVLVVALFQLQSPINLRDLALDGGLVVAGNILDQLLGDGGAALHASSGHGAEHGAYRPPPVHALVLVKALVLDGHGGVPQRLGDLVAGQQNAVLAVIEGLVDLPFVRFRVLGVHLCGQGHVVGRQIHFHLVFHGFVDINGKNNGEKGHGQQEHRKNGSHDEAHLAPARLDLPRASAARSGGSFAGVMLHFPFYFFGALLQLITQAFLLVLAFAHNGAPSFLSDVCIPCRNRLNTTKNPF